MAVLAIFTVVELKSAQCQTACRWAGYDDGEFKAEKCLCVDEKDFKEFTEKKTLIAPGLIFRND